MADWQIVRLWPVIRFLLDKMRLDRLLVFYFKLQYSALFKTLDLVESVDAVPSEPLTILGLQLNKPFLFLLLNFLFFNIYGTFALEYESTGKLPHQVDLLHSETLMYIQMHPRSIWPQMGVVYAITFTDIALIFLSLAFKPLIEKRFKILHHKEDGSLSVNGYKLNRSVSNEILTFNRRFRRIIKVVYVVFTITVMLYCFGMVYRNGNYRLSIVSGLFWCFQFPIMMFYYINIVMVTITYAQIACKFVQIQQKDLVEQFRHEYESQKIVQTYFGATSVQVRAIMTFKFGRSWTRYLALNAAILRICKSIQVYSNYWKVYLTLIIAHYVAFQCYIAFMILYLVSDLFWVRAFLFNAILEMDIQLFFFIRECAKIVKNNGAFERANRQFLAKTLHMKQMRNPDVKVLHLLKSETLHIPRTLQNYGFRLMDNYYITSNTFYSLFSATSIFFMMICRRKGGVSLFEED